MAMSDHDVGAALPYYTAALDDNPLVLVHTGSTLVYAVQIFNNTAATAFIRMYSAAAIGDVTVGSTTPTFALAVAASTYASYQFSKGILFPLGLVIGSCTTASGEATGASTDVALAYA